MSNLTFKSAKKRATAEPIEFQLDGEMFMFTPPKRIAMFLAADEPTHEQVRVQLNWLSAGLPKDQAERIKSRLMDFDDPLEVTTLLEVVGALIEEATGRPTGPSPD